MPHILPPRRLFFPGVVASSRALRRYRVAKCGIAKPATPTPRLPATVARLSHLRGVRFPTTRLILPRWLSPSDILPIGALRPVVPTPISKNATKQSLYKSLSVPSLLSHCRAHALRCSSLPPAANPFYLRVRFVSHFASLALSDNKTRICPLLRPKTDGYGSRAPHLRMSVCTSPPQPFACPSAAAQARRLCDGKKVPETVAAVEPCPVESGGTAAFSADSPVFLSQERGASLAGLKYVDVSPQFHVATNNKFTALHPDKRGQATTDQLLFGTSGFTTTAEELKRHHLSVRDKANELIKKWSLRNDSSLSSSSSESSTPMISFKRYVDGMTGAHHYPSKVLPGWFSRPIPVGLYVVPYLTSTAGDMDGRGRTSYRRAAFTVDTFGKLTSKLPSVELSSRLLGKTSVVVTFLNQPPHGQPDNVIEWTSALPKELFDAESNGNNNSSIQLCHLCYERSSVWNAWLHRRSMETLAPRFQKAGNFFGLAGRLSDDSIRVLHLYRPSLVSVLLVDALGRVRWHAVGRPTLEATTLLQ
eukprot:GHVT01032331.1.p1 GENE.GHVT01032331.1~~GHVT01032331.1.p1  ORF type:complete len:532 (-),score=34.96 GHVT01032331.1:682-2277(-)